MAVMERRRVLFFLCVLCFIGAKVVGSSPSQDTPYVQVDVNTKHFKDAEGSIRLFHGVNVVYKLPPYYPPILDSFDSNLSLSPEDAKNLYDWGMNFVRLYVAWPGYEVQRGQYNSTYLDELEKIVQILSEQGIYVLLDCHQDLFSRKYCGEGVPDFAAISETKKFPYPIQGVHLRYDNKTGYPLIEDCLKYNFGTFYLSGDVGEAFQNFYDNVDRISDDFTKFWGEVATRFERYDNVIGYEIINEPWAGDIYEDPFLFIPGHANKKNLAPLYEKVNTEIRKYDDRHIVFFESCTSDPTASGFGKGPGGVEYNNRQVLSYHIYCGDVKPDGDPRSFVLCDTQTAAMFELFLKSAKEIGGGAFLTEFGALSNSTGGVDDLNFLGDEADRHLQSWSYWQFKYYNDITTADKPAEVESFYGPDGNLQEEKVQALSRTYAQFISGDPISMTYDTQVKSFELRFSADPRVTTPTIIYLNSKMNYPNGYKVSVSPPQVTYGKIDENHIRIDLGGEVAEGTEVVVYIQRK